MDPKKLQMKALDFVFFIPWSTMETSCFLLTWFVRNQKHCSWWLSILACEVARCNGKTKEEFAVALDYASCQKPSKHLNSGVPAVWNHRNDGFAWPI